MNDMSIKKQTVSLIAVNPPESHEILIGRIGICQRCPMYTRAAIDEFSYRIIVGIVQSRDEKFAR